MPKREKQTGGMRFKSFLAKSFKQLIEKLLNNEEEIYDFLRENADDIEWD